MRGIIAGSLTAPALCGPAFAGPIMDGSVADSSIAVEARNSTDSPSPAVAGSTPATSSFFAREDQSEFVVNDGYVGRNHSGENDDVELVRGDPVARPRPYTVIVTGKRPGNAAGMGFRFVRRRS